MKAETQDVAIVGISCRAPGADSIAAFWSMLQNCRSGIGDIPADRWDIQKYYDADPMKPGKMNTKKGGYIHNIREFDAAFFNISPKEAESIDPQQRLMLEMTWEALEDAGILPEDIKGSKTGVFIGSCSNDFSTMVFNHATDHPYAGTGTTNCIIANRLSYAFDLRGPSMSYDAACASSLVAVINSCKSIMEGESVLAIAGGVHLTLLPGVTVSFSKAGLLSASNVCRPFDDRADGYLRSEGGGVIILKSLKQAQKDGDDIYAVIRGGAINHNGKSNGLSAPNPVAQEEVLKKAYENSGISSPECIGYIEAQGIGTRLGDAIEMKAISNFLKGAGGTPQVCKIGSLKSNIGHTEAASGILSLIKVALSMKNGSIPATINYEQPNSMVDLRKLNLEIQCDNTLWPKQKNYAGVSAFGFGGVNAHVVLQRAADNKVRKSEFTDTPLILVLTAKSEAALQKQCSAVAAYLSESEDADLEAICYTYAKKTKFNYRVAIPFTHKQEVVSRLNDYHLNDASDGLIKNKASKKSAQVVFLFTGNHSQYKNMGKGLYHSFPIYKQAFDLCDEIASVYIDKKLKTLLFDDNDTALESLLNDRPEYYHLAIFAVEFSLSELWKSWGIIPSAVAGSSLGEYGAACVAGVFSVKDAIYLVYQRASLFSRMPKVGSIIVAFADERYLTDKIARYKGRVEFAGFNGPKHFLLAGYKDAIEEISSILEDDLIRVFTLNSPVAYHSFLMEPAKEEWLAILKKVKFNRPNVPFVSTVLGNYCDEEVARPEYWYQHIIGPVYFQKSIEAIKQKNYDIFLEIGPKPIMVAMAAELFGNEKKLWLPSINQHSDEKTMILKSLASLFVNGGSVSWDGYFNNNKYSKQSVTSYQFDRQYFWPRELDTKPVITNGSFDRLCEEIEASGQLNAEQVERVMDIIRSNAMQDATTQTPSQSPPLISKLNQPRNIVNELAGMQDKNSGQQIMDDYFAGLIAAVLRLKKAEILPDVSLFNHGMDSLMAIEITERLKKDLDITVQTLFLMEEYTIEEIARELLILFNRRQAEKTTLSPTSDPNDQNPLSEDPDIVALKKMDELSEDELDRLIGTLDRTSINGRTSLPGKPPAVEPKNHKDEHWAGKRKKYSDVIKEKREYLRIALISKLSKQYTLHPVAENQKALWYIQSSNPNDYSYNLAFAVKIYDPINLDIFKAALQLVFERHDELRATFHFTGDAIDKHISKYSELFFELFPINGLADEDVLQIVKAKHREAFDLANGPLFKAYLFKKDDNGPSIFLLNINHIVIDGLSYWTLLKEISHFYTTLAPGQRLITPHKPRSYDQFVRLQTATLTGTLGDEMLQYWQEQLKAKTEALALPYDKVRPLVKSTNGASIEFTLSETLSADLRQLCNKKNTTMFTLLLAAFQTLLYKYSRQNDILVGTPFAARVAGDFNDTVGYFVNSVVINTSFTANETFNDILLQTKQKVNRAIEFQDYPFSLLVNKLGSERDPSRTPIFQAMFDLVQPREENEISELFANRNAGNKTQWGDFSVEPYGIVNEEAQFDISLRLFSGKGTLNGFFKYNADLFKPETIDRIKESYRTLLESIAADSSIPLSQLSVIPKKELEIILYDWNNTQKDFPDELLHRLIDKHAETKPDAKAAIHGDEIISYGELAARSNRFARFLIDSGVKPGNILPVLLDRSIDMLITILGIFKVGAVYVPLDKKYPFERICTILLETEARFVVSKGYLSERFENNSEVLPATFNGLLMLDDVEQNTNMVIKHFNPESYSSTTVDTAITPNDLCYIIYTSGSTGKPKGVMIQHKGMLNHLFCKVNSLHVDKSSRIVQNASQCFDISIWQFFTSFIAGGTTIIIPDEQLLNVSAFMDSVQRQGVTILEVVPSYLGVMLDEMEASAMRSFDRLKFLVVTGETLKPQMVRQWFTKFPSIPMVNAYGPTEASDDITHYFIYGELTSSVVPIGKPVQNMNIYIVDANGQPCPVGVKGEIWTSGIGVGKGYFKDPDKTRNAFSIDPFRGGDIPLYKTGDIGTYLPDGNILFLGRKDTQVKVKGFRIELEEIEHVLLRTPGVKNVAVKLIDEEERSFIAAYLQIDLDSNLSEIKATVTRTLPYYMIPDYYMVLDQFPVNANGKIDRNNLPKPETEVDRNTIKWLPTDEKEQIILDAWCDVLEVQNINDSTSFFSLGGDSIGVMRVVSRLRSKGLAISPANIFEFPFIKQLAVVANWIGNDAPKVASNLSEAPLTPIQKWLFQQDETIQNSYAMAVQITLPAWLDDGKVHAALTQLVAKHKQLQAIFPSKESQFIAIQSTEVQLEIEIVTTSPSSELANEIDSCIKAISDSFDPDKGGLFMAVIIKTGSKQNQLLLVSHHLIIDQLSWQIIFKDFIALCEHGTTSSMLSATYLEWASMLETQSGTKTLLNSPDYWKNEHLPIMGQSVPARYENSTNVSVTLDKDESGKLLNDIHHVYNTNTQDILLTALLLSFHKTNRQSEFVIDLENHGRFPFFDEKVDLVETVGWFTAQFPVKLSFQGRDIGENIKWVKEKLLKVPHNGISYGLLKYSTDPEISRQFSLVASPEILFNFLGKAGGDTLDGDWQMRSLHTERISLQKGIKTHSMEFNLMVTDGQLRVLLTYDRQLHQPQQMTSFLDTFIEQLQQVIGHCINEKQKQYTVSDFSAANLSQNDLNTLLKAIH